MKITKFDDITVSTKTFTTYSNINIDIAKLFNVIPITPYKIEQKKKRKKEKGYNTSQTTYIGIWFGGDCKVPR